MNETEWLDKQNGTRNALLVPQMSDTDRNIMRDLAGEADEQCVGPDCDVMLRPDHRGYFEFSLDRDGEEPVCEDCYIDAREVWEDAKAEAQREGQLNRSEAAFDARWPR